MTEEELNAIEEDGGDEVITGRLVDEVRRLEKVNKCTEAHWHMVSRHNEEWQRLADELAEALHKLCHPRSERGEALLAKHAKLKHGGGAKDGATEGHAADNIDIRPPMR